jgi:S-layer family protein
MPTKRSKNGKISAAPIGIRRPSVILICLLLSVVIVTGILAQQGLHKNSHSIIQSQVQPTATVAPTSFSANSPSKEYIYAGGRLVATEEPNSITPTSQAFPANGATNQPVNVTAPTSVSWTAVSNDLSWITISSGNSGSGNGVVTFNVAANSVSGAPRRVGTMTIYGQTFTVLQGGNFTDVQPGQPFYTEIGKFSARGLTSGCLTGTTYCPDGSVTREQMAIFIIKGMGDFSPPQPAQQRFSDVPPSNWFYAFIEQMAVRQITVGCGDGSTYCPGLVVTHEQMAAFIMRGRGEFGPPPPAQQRFDDVPSTNPFYAFIERMGALGIWPAPSGCTGNNYCPTSPVTRAQMAWIIVKAFNL